MARRLRALPVLGDLRASLRASATTIGATAGRPSKEGLEAPLENCPECDRDTFVVCEGRCANCGFSLEGYECAICSEPLSVDDYRYSDGTLCSYHQYVMSKDD